MYFFSLIHIYNHKYESIMQIKIRKNKRRKVRVKKDTFLFFPLLHNGRVFWLSRVRLEKAFNGYKMKIIKIEFMS
ncbi:hypothetical protein T190130A13A_60237 [Tenacibaculum sp. 190130A14a]